jgi:hypothetical protein
MKMICSEANVGNGREQKKKPDARFAVYPTMSEVLELRARAQELLAAARTTRDPCIAAMLREVATEFDAEATNEERAAQQSSRMSVPAASAANLAA